MTDMGRLLISSICLMSVTLTACNAQVKDYRFTVLETYPHDAKAYTQGLFFWNGAMYETTGEYGRSSIRRVDWRTGVPEVNRKLSSKYFGEGSCVVDGKMYVLTWQNKVAFVYDAATLKYEKTVSYPREGWGLAPLPVSWKGSRIAVSAAGGAKEDVQAVMVASDGSSKLFFLDREMRTLKTLSVTMDGRPLRLLNELEWIDGRIWANVYTTDLIVMIDPSSGKVTGRLDCTELFPHSKRNASMDVLNGIAFDGNDVFLTGKDWPKMFRVKVD